MAVSTSAIAYALKTVYTNREMQNAVYKDNPLFALMRKEGGFTGASHIHGVRYRDSLARSPTFATAQGRAGANGASGTDVGFTKGVQFIVTRRKEYQIYTLEQEAILAGRDDKGSLIRTLSTEVDSALNNLNRSFGQSVYRKGSGSLGTVTVAALVFTVGEAITNIEEGMSLVCAATENGALRNTAAVITPMVVTSVDRDAGSFTVDANTDGCATGDHLFIEGDRATGAITAASYLKFSGLDAWNPITAPSSGESFYGVDRSVDATRLAGQRKDISTLGPEEGYITALAIAAREGSSPSHIFTSFTDEKNLKLAVGSRVEMEWMAVGDIGFESMKIRGPKGPVRLFADVNAPVGYARLLQLDTWAFKHLGDLINTADLDGSRLAREYQADRFEGRLSTYGNVVCYAPSKNMVCTLPT